MLQLSVFVDTKHAVTKLEIKGSLDSETAAQFTQETRDVFKHETKMLVMDMAGLDYISSAGIREVFKLAKQAKQKNVRCSAVNRQPQITRVFEIVKALPDLRIFKDQEEMDAYLKAMQDDAKL